MVGASRPAGGRAASVAAVEPTPIFAALATPAAHGDERADRRSVPEILRALRAERDATPPGRRARVGHVPGVLSFRPTARD